MRRTPAIPDAPPARASRAAWVVAALAVPAAVLLFHARAAAPGQAFVGQDLRDFFFATREATAEALRHGRLPGWQRGMFLGYPLLADPQIALFDPATWITLPWDAPRALTLATLLHLVVGGLGVLLWLALRGLSPVEALLGALLFALGAKQTVHLQHWNFAASTAWWGFALAGLEGFAARARPAEDGAGDGRGRGRWLLLTAGASAMSWFGGAAQMAYFGTLVAGAYAVVLAPRLWRRSKVDPFLALAAGPVGLLLAAPLVLPVLELAALGPRGAGVDYRFVTSWKWPDRWGWALFVLPNAFGGRWHLQEMNLWEATGYLGLVPVALALAAPLRRRGAWLFLLLGAVGVWLCWGEDAWLGVHRAFHRFLPGYGSFRNPTRTLFVTSLVSALLAAEGLAAFRRRLRTPASLGRALAPPAAALALLAAAALALPRLHRFPLDRARALAEAPFAAAVCAAGIGWLALAWWLGRRARPAWIWSLWACAALPLALVDLHHAFGSMNPVAPAAGEQPLLADARPYLPEAPGPRRLAVLARWGRTANAPLRTGLEGVTGYGPTVIQRVRSLLEATHDDRVVPPRPVDGDTDFPRPRPTSELWPLLGAPLLASDEDLPLPQVAPLRPEWSAHPVTLYATPALPRVFWAGAWSAVRDEAVATPILEAAGGDRAVIDPAGAGAFAPSGAPEGPVSAEEVRVDGGIVEATLVAPRDGVAVVLEPWFPGWRATLDGEPVPLARADFAFMAVPAPAGRHALRLVYRPTQLARGAEVALATAALLLAVLALRRRLGAGALKPRPD